MGLDIRWPIGIMFSIVGFLLVVYGLLTGSNSELYRRSLDINVNLYWGMPLVVFGLAMLLLAWRSSRRGGPAGPGAGQDKSR